MSCASRLLPCLLVALLTASLAAAEFRSDGVISSGGCSLRLDGDGTIVYVNPSGDRLSFHLSCDERKRWFTGKNLDQRALTVDQAQRTVRFSGAFRPQGAERDLRITTTMALAEAGTVRVETTFDWPQPLATVLGYAYVNAFFERDRLGSLLVDGGEVRLAPGWKPAVPREVVLFPGVADRALALRPVAGRLALSEEGSPAAVRFSFSPDGNRIAFDLDLGQPAASSENETHAGIDFWRGGRLHVPRYQLSRNLVQNPGFEDGLRHWHYGPWGVVREARVADQYLAVEEGPFEGRRCLRMSGFKGQAPTPLNAFAIPVEAGASYTLSFHARADRAGRKLGTSNVSARWPVFPGSVTVDVGTEWKRHQVTFTAPNALLAIGFNLGVPAEDCTVWLDGVQLEKGPMTAFVCKPVSASLATAARDHIVLPGAPVQAVVELAGVPGTAGSLAVAISDDAGQELHREQAAFTLAADGRARHPLPWLEGRPVGLYQVRLDLSGPEGFSDREFERLAVMPAAVEAAQRRLFCAYGRPRDGDWARRLAWLHRVGMGSEINFDPPPYEHPTVVRANPNNEYLDLMAQEGTLNFSSILDSGGISGPHDLYTKVPAPTPEVLKTFEDNAYAKALLWPNIRYWKLWNEPQACSFHPSRRKGQPMEDVVKLMAAAVKGVRRANPQALIMTPDPCNMAPRDGIAFIDEFLAAGGTSLCDIVAIHPYRTRPEEPNLEADFHELLAVMERRGQKGPVWFTEGIFHVNYVIPALDVDAHRGCSSDHYMVGPLSYHLAAGERICAAYLMRSWLAALRFGSKVEVSVDWGFQRNSYLGVDLVPTATAFVPGVLGRLVSGARFDRDVSLGEDLHCQLYEDRAGRPVAALWSSAWEVDNGSVPGPLVDFSGLPAGCERFAWLGTPEAPPADGRRRVDSFPLFLRGAPGSLAAFAEALAGLRVLEGRAQPLHVFARPLSSTAIEVVARNRLSRPLAGQATVACDGGPATAAALAVRPGEEWRTTIAVAAPVPGTMPEHRLEVRAAPAGMQPLAETLAVAVIAAPRLAAAPVIDGDSGDWPGSALTLPARLIDLPAFGKQRERFPAPPPWRGDSDLSATLRVAWDAGHLYLGVTVRDDVLDPAAAAAGQGGYQGDGLQIYLDGWADARTRTRPGHDFNDQSFTAWWGGGDTPQVWRDFAPDQQVAFLKVGTVAAARCAFRRSADGWSCELALPAEEVKPLLLRAGGVFGLGLLINDRDQDYRKRALTLLSSGEEPLGRPHQFPFVVLQP